MDNTNHDCCESDHCHDDQDQHSSTTYERKVPKLGRNDPCDCGSGKKYKKCCL